MLMFLIHKTLLIKLKEMRAFIHFYGVMFKVLDCGIVVREFELQLRYYVHFWTSILGKGMTLPILPVRG